jgi:uncharacterized protein involved in type VI secretion and phage assembly
MDETLPERLLDWIRSHYFGKYRGVVVDNDDATDRGRIKVRVPAVLGSLEVWAMPCVPYAGAGVGFYSLPKTGTGVWIEFEAGDVSYPVWTGCFWADGELPDAGGAPIKIWKTEKLTLRIDDDADEMLLETTSQSSITVASDVTTSVGSASHTVATGSVVSELGNGKVEVTPSSVRLNGDALEVT